MELTPIVASPNRSASLAELTKALAIAQGQFDHAKKAVENEFFKSRYADLASVIDAAKKPLADNGLAVIQLTEDVDGVVYLLTLLSHTSGEWVQSRYPIKPTKNDPQGMGSAITYARRYCFSAITGIASDDDDGNAASAQAKPAKKADVSPSNGAPSEFERAAKRNAYQKNALAGIEGAVNGADLANMWDVSKKQWLALARSQNDADNMAGEEIIKQWVFKHRAVGVAVQSVSADEIESVGLPVNEWIAAKVD